MKEFFSSPLFVNLKNGQLPEVPVTVTTNTLRNIALTLILAFAIIIMFYFFMKKKLA